MNCFHGNFDSMKLKSTVWKSRLKHNHHFYGKNQHFFRQINVVTKEVTKELISRKIFKRDRVLQYFSTL